MFYGWYIVGSCCLISLYISGSINLGFTAVFEPIVKEFNWSYTQVSFATSLRGVEVGLLAPVAGMLMDRWGARCVVFCGALLSGLGLVLLSHIHTLTMFYACFILIAAGASAASSTLLMATVANWFHKNMGLAMGIAASGVSLGGILIPLITELTDTFGWRQAMLITGLGMWVVPVPLSLFLRHKPEQYGYLPDGEKRKSAFNPAHTFPLKSEGVKVGAKEALASRSFWIIAIAFLFQMLPLSAVVTHIMPYLSTIGIERSTSKFIAAALPMMTIIGRVGFGWLGDRIDKKTVATLAFALTAFGLFIFGLLSTDRAWLIGVFIIFYAIGWGGGVPILNGLLKEYFGRERLSTLAGLTSGVMMLGMIAGAPLAGWVFDTWGRYQPTWFSLAGLASITTILFYVCLKNASQR
ncbi:MAG: MFS transporter [Deltaproteobacteria bacterium]|nr:MFS transporter [Deltaproteobacteria bacterium]